MGCVKFFWHGEIGATQLPWADVAGYSALPSHRTQESKSAELMVMYGGEQSWQRTRWQDTFVHSFLPREVSGECVGVHAAEKPQDQPHQGRLLPSGSPIKRKSHAKGYTNTMRRMKRSHLPARHFRAVSDCYSWCQPTQMCSLQQALAVITASAITPLHLMRACINESSKWFVSLGRPRHSREKQLSPVSPNRTRIPVNESSSPAQCSGQQVT